MCLKVRSIAKEEALTGKKARSESLGEIFTREFLLLSTINLAMFFGFQMLNIGLPMYMDQLGATGQIVGLATTLMTVMATIMRVFAGAMLDRFGRMGMLIGGTIVMACSIVAFAIFPIVGVILGLRLLHGVGWGLGSTACATVAADIIPKKRFAEGMGYFAMTNAISSALAPAVALELVQGVGSVYMILVSAAITVLALILSFIEIRFSRRRNAQEKAVLESESPAGSTTAPSEGQPQADEVSPAGAPPKGAALAQPQKEYSKFDTLFERRAILPGILMMLANVGFGTIATFIALHADAQGVEGVSIYFVVYAVITLASRPFIGRLIDRHGYRIPAILSTICTAATLVIIGVSDNLLMFSIAGALGGLGIGTAMGTFQAMAVASVEPWRRGVATSTFMTLFDLGIAIGATFGGVIVDIAGYAIMYFVVALFPIIASIISAVAIKKTARNQ